MKWYKFCDLYWMCRTSCAMALLWKRAEQILLLKRFSSCNFKSSFFCLRYVTEFHFIRHVLTRAAYYFIPSCRGFYFKQSKTENKRNVTLIFSMTNYNWSTTFCILCFLFLSSPFFFIVSHILFVFWNPSFLCHSRRQTEFRAIVSPTSRPDPAQSPWIIFAFS